MKDIFVTLERLGKRDKLSPSIFFPLKKSTLRFIGELKLN